MEAITFLKEIMSIPSVNGRDDEGKVSEYLYAYLKSCGLRCELDRIDSLHANVVAWMDGTDTEHTVLWNGHVDTVPYGELKAWDSGPSVPTLKENMLYGRGASDMKSGLAAMAWLLGEMKRQNKVPSCNIVFAATCDEECGGLGASAFLHKDILNHVDEIVVGEPTGKNLGIAQKGCLWLEISGKGKTSHGAYPEKGWNAIASCMEIADAIRKRIQQTTHPILGTATAQVTQITGGVAPNMTPDSCRLLMDIRMVPGMTVEEILEQAGKSGSEIEKISNGKFEYSVKICNNRGAIEIPENHSLVERFRRELRRDGYEPENIGINYFTDASIFRKVNPVVPVLLFGPGDPTLAHQPNECVNLEFYEDAIKILKRVFWTEE